MMTPENWMLLALIVVLALAVPIIWVLIWIGILLFFDAIDALVKRLKALVRRGKRDA